MANKSLHGASPYNGALTREQFCFYEMRTTAQLMGEGLPDEEIVEKIMAENLFQYPTERTVRQMVRNCISRLRAMESEMLIRAVSEQPVDSSKQICLYAMMKQNRLVWDFMITVIGEKYRTQDLSFSRKDLNVFFIRLQEQDDAVASWSENTVKKIKSVLCGILVKNGYLDGPRADHLNPVWLSSVLENGIRTNHDFSALPAFNCFS